MRNTKKLKKVILASTAFLLVGTAGLMDGQAHAAGANNKFQSIFNQVGLKFAQPKTAEASESSESPNNQKDQKNPVNNEESVKFGDKVIATGEKYMGTPYKLGANYQRDGKFDCSAFTQHVFKQNGVKLPRSSASQSTVGVEVPRNQLQKGDLVFFKLKGRSGIRHVGIYAGNGKVLHTWGPGGVRYDNMSTRWLDQGFVKATRVSS